MDRLEVIQMPSYTDEEKIAIAKGYVLPHYLKESGLTANDITIEESVWEKITRPLGFDAGIRTLERTVEGVVRKAAYKMVNGQPGPFHISETNVKEFM